MDRLLAEERAATNVVIQAELLIGAKHEREYRELDADLSALPHLGVTGEVWALASRLGFALRRAGATVPIPDLVIASTALSYGCALLHLDEDFKRIARRAPLKLYKPMRTQRSRT